MATQYLTIISSISILSVIVSVLVVFVYHMKRVTEDNPTHGNIPITVDNLTQGNIPNKVNCSQPDSQREGEPPDVVSEGRDRAVYLIRDPSGKRIALINIGIHFNEVIPVTEYSTILDEDGQRGEIGTDLKIAEKHGQNLGVSNTGFSDITEETSAGHEGQTQSHDPSTDWLTGQGQGSGINTAACHPIKARHVWKEELLVNEQNEAIGQQFPNNINIVCFFIFSVVWVLVTITYATIIFSSDS